MRITIILAVSVVLFSVMSLSRNGLWSTNVGLWSDVTRKSPGKARGFYPVALGMIAAKRYDLAAESLVIAIKNDRRFPQFHYFLGISYVNLGRFDAAMDEFEETLRLNKFLGSGHFGAGTLYVAESHSAVGNIHMVKGDAASAIAHYKEAVKLKKDDVGTLYNMGIAYKRLGSTNDAAAVFEEILRVSPSDAAARYQLDALRSSR